MKRLLLCAVVCGLGMASVAAEHLEERTSQAGTNDCPNLPEIYLIGDSIRMGYCKDVAKALEGKASVKWPQGNCANSQNILISLGWWRKCASAAPTVIQFNCGHWDVSNWDNDDGPITSLEEYRRNVRMIIRRLRRYYPTSKLVFATTTPMKPGLGKVAVARRTTEEIVRYNAAAVAVAKEEGIAVNDLFAVAKDWPATEFADYCHFKAPANEKLGKAVADFVETCLRPEPKSETSGIDPAKFHVYLLAGQSNMAGRGELTPSNRVSTARVLKMDKEGRWVPAEEPIHFDVPSIAGAGLGASFARAMADTESDVTIGLVPCAVGGSPMWRWDPGTMYYTNTIARARAAMKVGTLKGILWHQGCSEANVETNAFGYAERVAKMMRSFRKDLGTPDVSIVAGELGWFLDDVVGYKPSKYWRQVNAEINRLPRLLEKCAVVSSEGLTANADNLHFNTPSQRTFGLRYAKAMRGLQTGELRIGVIGCDTSHAVEFAENPAFNVVCAYKWGSKDIFSSTNRYPAYIARMRELGVTMVESIPELLAKCDAVLLETNDGRPHLEQATEVFRSGIPVFIDKPLAGSWEDCVKIYAAAKAAKATFFSGSALHYNSNAVAVARGDFGAVRGAVAWSPDNFEPTQQEYFWYGVHGVELLFGALGPGCEKVSCTRTEEGDAITGVWSDGRIGIVKLNNVARKVNACGFGGRAFTAKGVIDLGGWESYQGLENDILAYFRTGRPPRTLDEQLEIYAFMEAARRSQAEGGRQVAVPKP